MDNKPRLHGLAWFGTLAAMLACYGTIALVAILALLGISLAVNPVAQAGLISFFALLVVAVILSSARQTRHYGPSVLAVMGAGIILWVMWGNYNWMTELGGFAAMLCATYWDWRLRKSCPA